MELESLVRIDPGVCRAPINTRLQPGAKRSKAEAVSTALSREEELLKQFIVFIAARTGLKPGVNGKCRVTSQNA